MVGHGMTWPVQIKFGEIGREPKTFAFEADVIARKEIVKRLDLLSLESFSGEITVTPWLDGATIDGRYHAELAQTCGVTAEPLPQTLSNRFSVRVLPIGSPNAPAEPAVGGEIEIDLESDDPPDLLEGDVIDLTNYAVEHLGLDLDPFPRKPGAEFTPPANDANLSPFAVLKAFKPRDEA
jgi:hypothetical protein